MAARPLGEIPRKELSLQLSPTNQICLAFLVPGHDDDGDDHDHDDVDHDDHDVDDHDDHDDHDNHDDHDDPKKILTPRIFLLSFL